MKTIFIDEKGVNHPAIQRAVEWNTLTAKASEAKKAAITAFKSALEEAEGATERKATVTAFKKAAEENGISPQRISEILTGAGIKTRTRGQNEKTAEHATELEAVKSAILEIAGNDMELAKRLASRAFRSFDATLKA